MRINEIRCDCCNDVILNGDNATYRLMLKSPDGIAFRFINSIDLCQNCETLFHPEEILKEFKKRKMHLRRKHGK